MVPFGGWEMPLAYPDGTLAEHRACRTSAVAFDVSHLGTVRVEGAGSRDLLQRTLTNDLDKVEPGRAQYSLLLDEADASVLDDLIVWWRDDERFDVMPNASNTDRVTAALPGGEDVTAERVVVAVQGPDARDRLRKVAPEAADVGRFRVASFEFEGVTATVAGTGYTGEDGVECAVPRDRAESFWQALLDAGIAPAGLGARDTLRLEMGFPLHGHEFGPGVTPLQTGHEWVVGWQKPEFRGKVALEAERARGPARRLRGLVLDGKRPPRADQAVVVDGDRVGTVTSGNYSPVLDRGIALAFLPPELGPGTRVVVDVRGRDEPAEVVDPPFRP
jgi:aminomethyltransferase